RPRVDEPCDVGPKRAPRPVAAAGLRAIDPGLDARGAGEVEHDAAPRGDRLEVEPLAVPDRPGRGRQLTGDFSTVVGNVDRGPGRIVEVGALGPGVAVEMKAPRAGQRDGVSGGVFVLSCPGKRGDKEDAEPNWMSHVEIRGDRGRSRLDTAGVTPGHGEGGGSV